MTRIIAGHAKGKSLLVPKAGTRPTSDRAREALFSTVSSLRALEGSNVLDLYAGSGALGLEALSRGAAAATFVEANKNAANLIKKNIETIGLPGAVCLWMRVEKFMTATEKQKYDIVFADPPYDVTAQSLTSVLAAMVDLRALAKNALIVVERSSRDASWEWPTGIEPVQHRKYGEATLWYGEWAETGHI